VKKRCLLAALFCGLLVVAQRPPGSLTERFRGMSEKAEKEGLAAPFRGITTDGSVAAGLFPVRATGVPTTKVRNAAKAFLASLTAEQRAKTLFPVDDPEWRKWMNQHFYIRQGVGFNEMSDRQRDAAFSLMSASLSVKGMKLARDIMRLNHTLGELNNDDFIQYGEWLYWITIMGEPSEDRPWGWQIDGHHLIVNYFVLGDQVVMTPVFVGSEPVVATTGKYKGTAILQEEQGRGLQMLRALDGAQQRKAIVQTSKTNNNNLTEAFKDNVTLEYAGIRASDLDERQRKELEGLIELYVSNMDDGHAKVKMEEVRKHLSSTWFAWIGGTGDKSVYYYRIQSPVILIEFDHQRPVGTRHLFADPSLPERQHVHVVVRTPNGNDYGKDLLRQHYEKSHRAE
jgi:hypothetical protein